MSDNMLQALIDQLRANGVTRYRGQSGGGEIELELGPSIAPAAPSTPAPRPEPTEPEPRGDDGLTKEQQAEWYRSSGG